MLRSITDGQDDHPVETLSAGAEPDTSRAARDGLQLSFRESLRLRVRDYWPADRECTRLNVKF
jgi:hypothetical protein